MSNLFGIFEVYSFLKYLLNQKPYSNVSSWLADTKDSFVIGLS